MPEPPRGERDHLGALGVEPLHVVDRDQQPLVRGEQRDAGQPDAARVRRRVAGVGAQQRDLERTPLRGREAVEVRGAEQVAERDEREPALGARGARREHVHPDGARGVGARAPDGALADPRLARDDDRALVGERGADARELGVSAERNRHGPTLHRACARAGCRRIARVGIRRLLDKALEKIDEYGERSHQASSRS